MTLKIKPCTQGARHKWKFVKNSTYTQASWRGASISLRGIYRCECGQKKLGDAGQEAHNSLNDFVAAMAGVTKP